MPLSPTHSATLATSNTRMAVRWGRSWLSLVGFGLYLLAMSGCSSMRAVDSQVLSFAGPASPIPAGAQVQLARLPSQENSDFEPIQQALERVLRDKGLAPVTDNSAPWVLHVQWKVRAVEVPQALAPRQPFGTNIWLGTGGTGASFVFHVPAVTPTWTALDLDVVLRERASQSVAFEAHASHQGPWSDALQLAPAVVNAAFQHYPNGKPQLHTVIEEIAK